MSILLTAKNLEVFELTCRGNSQKEIAEKLHITHQAVSQHQKRLHEYIYSQDPESPLLKGKRRVNELIGEAVDAYEEIVKPGEGRKDLRLKAAEHILKYSGVFEQKIDIGIRDEVRGALEQKRLAVIEKLQEMSGEGMQRLAEQFGGDCQLIEADVEVIEEEAHT